MEALPGLWSLTPIGALVGVLVWLLLAVSRGWIIPKSSHEREMDQANKRGDEWKETALDQRAVNQEIRAQNTMLLEGARIAGDFFGKASVDIEDTQGGGQHVGS